MHSSVHPWCHACTPHPTITTTSLQVLESVCEAWGVIDGWLARFPPRALAPPDPHVSAHHHDQCPGPAVCKARGCRSDWWLARSHLNEAPAAALARRWWERCRRSWPRVGPRQSARNEIDKGLIASSHRAKWICLQRRQRPRRRCRWWRGRCNNRGPRKQRLWDLCGIRVALTEGGRTAEALAGGAGPGARTVDRRCHATRRRTDRQTDRQFVLTLSTECYSRIQSVTSPIFVQTVTAVLLTDRACSR